MGLGGNGWNGNWSTRLTGKKQTTTPRYNSGGGFMGSGNLSGMLYGEYNRDRNRAAAESGTPIPTTNASMSGWWGAMRSPYQPGGLATTTTPTNTGSSGGGGGGYGGGGGGSGITQAMIDAMVRTLGIMPTQQTYQNVDLPDFQGQNIAAFDPSMYQMLAQQLQSGITADQANITSNQAAVTDTLNQNYQNPYANAQVVQGAPASPVGGALAASTGGDSGAVQQASQAVAGGNADSQAAFQNLYNVLSAANQQSQGSRMNQVAMDANYARQGLAAQGRAMSGQIGLQQSQAHEAWAQRDAERRYQNNLMGQQWNREEAQTNATGRQAATQANWQAQNDARTARIQPLLDLISRSGGAGLNLNSLNALLGRLGA
jgi:hypothetical protein